MAFNVNGGSNLFHIDDLQIVGRRVADKSADFTKPPIVVGRIQHCKIIVRARDDRCRDIASYHRERRWRETPVRLAHRYCNPTVPKLGTAQPTTPYNGYNTLDIHLQVKAYSRFGCRGVGDELFFRVVTTQAFECGRHIGARDAQIVLIPALPLLDVTRRRWRSGRAATTRRMTAARAMRGADADANAARHDGVVGACGAAARGGIRALSSLASSRRLRIGHLQATSEVDQHDHNDDDEQQERADHRHDDHYQIAVARLLRKVWCRRIRYQLTFFCAVFC
jgi:hypothetical protein